MRPKRIVEIMRQPEMSAETGKPVTVKGWIRTRRDSKQVSFVALNDGSSVSNLQVVIDPAKTEAETMRRLTTGACVSVTGNLVASQGKGQSVEVQAESIEILGDADATFPLQKKGHSWEYLREIAHLRPRTNTFGAIFRIRNAMPHLAETLKKSLRLGDAVAQFSDSQYVILLSACTYEGGMLAANRIISQFYQDHKVYRNLKIKIHIEKVKTAENILNKYSG